MGYNTAAIILNDQLSDVRDDPAIGKKIYAEVGRSRSDGYVGHGMVVLPSMHADTAQIVVIAANSIALLGHSHWRDTPEDLLRGLADQMGFRVVRKATK